MGIDDDALIATRTGIWRWDNRRGVISVDALAAELIGLPPEPGTFPEGTVRACFHTEDYIAARRHLVASAAEGNVAEAELRVVDATGTVLRVVRSRVRATERRQWATAPAAPASLVGLLSESPLREQVAPPVETDWWRVREAFVLDAGQALSEAQTTSEVLRVIGSLSMPGYEPAAVAVYARSGDELRVVQYLEHDAAEARAVGAGRRLRSGLPVDASFPPAEVARTGRAQYVTSPAEYQRRFPDAWPLIAPFGRRSWAYLPLFVAGRGIGVWLVAFNTSMAFTFEERALLSNIARLLSQAMARTRLHDTERELSADLQHTMRPSPTLRVPGMQVAARYVPTGAGLQVGGDWYDVIPLPSGRVALVIGDVQGHDVRAAAIMAQLRIALRAYASEGHRPDAVLSRAARFLDALASPEPDRTPGSGRGGPGRQPVADERFATCLYVEVDPRSGTMDVARAGHLDPAVLSADGILATCPTTGDLPLGVASDCDYPLTRLALQPGETLLMCTDGLVETGRRNRDHDEGWAALGRAVAPLNEPRLEELADILISTVHRAPTPGTEHQREDEDDIALLLLRRPAEPLASLPVRRMMVTVAQTEAARVADARARLEALLHDWQDRERVFGAVLMLSELLTNALTHTEGDAVTVAELRGRPGGRRLRVEVSDASDALPHRREPGELASSGRGLLLMDSLADEWGVAPRGEGKTTWFELGETAGDA